ncbi:hypothetical protein HII31_13712 [Pseudocercospora fuligena]|uniref:Uncharacterized protein n=1 Tax=Pseudocercospora fuligena TaxID=685502 RepID=A0A8H6R643_9PEZI|nr:hypothetical protein HII31_13712 [Pseudocercospora fuligena]
MTAPNDCPATIDVKHVVSQLEAELPKHKALGWRRDRHIRLPPWEYAPQMPITVVCCKKLDAINLKKPKEGEMKTVELKTVGCLKSPRAKEEMTEKIVEHFQENYESRPTKLAGIQDLCVHLGLRKGRTEKECKESLQEAGSRGVYINIYDFMDARREGTKVYRFPGIEPLRYYSTIMTRIVPLYEVYDNDARARAQRASPLINDLPSDQKLKPKEKKKRKYPDTLAFMLVNMHGNYEGKAFDKGRESMKARAQNLENSWSQYDGKTKTNKTPRSRRRNKGRNTSKTSLSGDSENTSDAVNSDGTSEPKTPDGKDMEEVVDLMKTLGIPNGV